MKATFNLNSERLGLENIVEANDVKHIYAGHEVAAHTLTHPRLTDLSEDSEIIRQVEQDRLNLSELVGYEVCGMAYPGGGKNSNEHIAELIRKHTGIKYARTTMTTHSYGLPNNLYLFQGTADVYNEENLLGKLATDFLNLQTSEPSILYFWGHSYEFDYDPTSWDRFEKLCAYISRRSDIYYGTNKEVLLQFFRP